MFRCVIYMIFRENLITCTRPTALYCVMCVCVCINTTNVKRPKHESRAKVQNAWSCTFSAPHVYMARYLRLLSPVSLHDLHPSTQQPYEVSTYKEALFNSPLHLLSFLLRFTAVSLQNRLNKKLSTSQNEEKIPYLVNKTNLVHNFILGVFINRYMFRAIMGWYAAC